MENLNFNEILNNYMGRATISSNNLSLGRLIQKLDKFNDDLVIQTTNGFYLSDKFGSYRGYYRDMYINYTSKESEALTVKSLKELLLRALSQQKMIGYKGGEYPINKDTLLWLSYYGMSGLMIIDVFEDNDSIVMIVEDEEE